jgi:hypothetical protein
LSNIENLIDINKRKGLPRTYRFSPFARWFTLILGSFALLYSIWFIFFGVEGDTSTLKKVIPFLILFFTLNSVLKNLFSINCIRFDQEKIEFRFLARKRVTISWNSIQKLSYSGARPRAIKIAYQAEEAQKTFLFPISFPNMLEIVNSMAELLPDVEFDDFMRNVIISDKEKKHIRHYKDHKMSE